MDPDARPILDELRGQGLSASQVHSILITHAHPDHWGATAAFPGARVYAGEGDVPVLQGRASLKGPMSGVLRGMMPPLSWSVNSASAGLEPES